MTGPIRRSATTEVVHDLEDGTPLKSLLLQRDVERGSQHGYPFNVHHPLMAKLPAIKKAAPAPAGAKITLPAVTSVTGPMLTALTEALGVERDVLAADDQIDHAWTSLPRLLSKIPPELRSDTLVRMCVAVATGLFDSAINYAWNAAIVELREKVRRFGLNVVPQVIAKQFDEAALLDLKDAELLELCLKLNLISEEGYFLLDQCRDI